MSESYRKYEKSIYDKYFGRKANQVVGIFAGLAVYDRTFFRRHLVTLWNIGLYKVCWEGFTFNNRMSSGIKLL